MSIGQSVITTCRVNIRIHRDIEGKMWFGVGYIKGLFVLRNFTLSFAHKISFRIGVFRAPSDAAASPTMFWRGCVTFISNLHI